MATNPNWPKELSQKWSEITRDDLRDQIVLQKLLQSIGLKESLNFDIKTANENSIKILFTYYLYGAFQDMGVGRGNPIGLPGKRKPRKWYARAMTRHQARFADMLTSKYGKLASVMIMENFPKKIII